MNKNFLKIQKDYLQQAWSRQTKELETAIPACWQRGCFHFHAFGEPCELHPTEIILGGQSLTGPEGILIDMYASHVPNEEIQLHPLKSFKELPESMPYQGAFSIHAEKVLTPYVPIMKENQQGLVERFSGTINQDAPSGDFSFTLYPLPRVALYYIFYLPDEEFSASVTCLFPANVNLFLPVAGLADVAEYTAKKIIELITEVKS